jgi:hypothetical protein
MNPMKQFKILIGLMFFSIPLIAQYQLEWSRNIALTNGGLVRIDSAYNIYVTGTNDDNTAGYVCKYDSSGNQLWYHPLALGHSSINDIVIDDSSNIYLTGASGIYIDPSTESAAAFVRKYDSTGAILWTDEYRRHSNSTWNSTFDILLDGSNGILVKGVTEDSADSYNFDLLIKYSTGGNRMWLSTDSLNPGGAAYKICTDASGSIYFASGYVFNAPSVFKFFKYDMNGNKLWMRSDTANAGYNYSIDIQYHDSCIYVLKDSGHGGFTVLRYDSSGTLVTTVSYEDSSANIQPQTLKIFDSGHSYVAGTMEDYFLARIDNDTVIAWASRIDCGTNQYDILFSSVSDMNENTYLVGRGNGLLNSDMVLTLLDSSGTNIFIDTYHQPSSTWTEGDDVTIDSRNNLYVIGTCYDPAVGNSAIIRKYAPLINSVSKDNEITEVKVFPNPASTRIYFQLNPFIICKEVFVYNSIGEVIVRKKLDPDNSLNVEGLHSGFYSYKLETNQEAMKGSFILNSVHGK